MTQAWILAAGRTAIGRRNGTLAATRPDDLAGRAMRALVEGAGVAPAQVEDVVLGCVTQIGEQGFNVARVAALCGGFPITTTGTTVNRQCGSSLQAVNFAAQGVMSGMQDLVMGAGVESMSRVEMGTDGGPLSELLTERFDIIPQGLSAELIAEKWGFSREDLDGLAVESHRRAIAAMDEGYFSREILPLEIKTATGEVVTFAADEGPRRESTMERVGKLRPAFKPDGVVTAASSSQISDGAAAVLIGTEVKAKELGVKPRARIVAMALSGVDPIIMLTGPIPATRKVLEKAGLGMDDIGLFEVNEAFASVVLAWAHDLSPNPKELLLRTNVNGGAMALGHPLGASGARILTTLLHEMERRNVRYGLATLCIGFGQAVATIIERAD